MNTKVRLIGISVFVGLMIAEALVGMPSMAVKAKRSGRAPTPPTGPALSWNLSRDMLTATLTTNNPLKIPKMPPPVISTPWTFMGWTSPNNTPSGYTALTPFGNNDCPSQPQVTPSYIKCWRGLSTDAYFPNVFFSTKTRTLNYIGGPVPVVRGVPLLHPSPDKAAVVRWVNPISGTVTVNISGRFSDIDPNGGDGIHWSIEKGTAPSTVLDSGTVPNGLGSTFLLPSVTVNAGEALYFIVDAGINNDYNYDSTEFDVLITSQQ